MSKSPKRKASAGPKRKPVTIDMEAEKAPASKATETAKSTVRSTPRVGRDAAKTTSSKTTASASEPLQKAEPEEQAKPKASPNPAPAKTEHETPKASGGLGRVAAGIVGGAIALGGGAAAQYAGVLPSFGGPEVSGFASENALRETNASLETQLAEIRQQLEGLKNAHVEASGPNMAEVQKAIDESIASAQQPGSDAGIPEDVAAQIAGIEDRAVKLETALSETQTKLVELSTASSSAEADPQFTALSDRVDIVAGNLATLKQDVTKELSKEGIDPVAVTALGATVAGITTKLSTIDGRIADITARTEALPPNVASSEMVSEAVAGAQSALDTKISGLTDQVGGLSDQLSQQGEQVAALEAKLADGADKRAARALIAAQLKGEVDRGLPFESTLQTFRTSTSDAEAYAAIAPFASKGIPTIAALADQFDGSVSQTIIDATTPVEKMSFADRLLAGAKSMVKVKPIGAVEGDGVDAIISRIGSALAQGDAAAANAAWATLPQAGKEASAQWQISLQAREQANTLLNTSVSNFISSTVSN